MDLIPTANSGGRPINGRDFLRSYFLVRDIICRASKRKKENSFGDHLFILNRETNKAEEMLRKEDWCEVARATGKICAIMEKYRGNAGDSQAAYDTYDNTIVPHLIGRLICKA